ncbi:helix-turn-helix domain-containing protein [Microlunatus sp. Gsoil 973]|nr:helix-turn-helix domain-containing protein [Microlunatus sp. Gsoil 973]
MEMTMAAAAMGPALLADYPPAAIFGPRLMHDYEFVWLLRGSALWSIDDDQHLLRPGTLALGRPGVVDCYRWDSEQPSTHAYVHFGLTGVDQLPDRWPAVRSLVTLPVLDGMCRYLLQLAGDPSPESAARRDQLLGLMVEIFVAGPVPRGEAVLPQVMITIAGRVRSDWDRYGIRQLGVDVLAAAGGVSAGHLHRLFRDQFGVGPGRALELIRLARAATTLRRSSASIAEVSALTGFANPYHFSRRFSAVYGEPPGRYRQAEDPIDPLAPLQDTGLLQLSYLLG